MGTTEPLVERDGSYLDSDGYCKLCGIAAQDGHTSNCDIWKLAQSFVKKYDKAMIERDRYRGKFNDVRMEGLRYLKRQIEKDEA